MIVTFILNVFLKGDFTFSIKKNRESSSLEFPLRLGLAENHLNSMSALPMKIFLLATSMVCDIQCSQCLLRNDHTN